MTIKSTGASAPPGDDVTVRLTYNGVPVCEKKLSVYAPTSTQMSPTSPIRIEYEEIMYGITPYGWDVWYRFTTLDQFGDPLPDGIEINETFGTFVSDYAGEDWSPLTAVGDTFPTAIFEDLYRILVARPRANPDPALLAHTGYFTKVFHVEQKYYAGSTTSGSGRLIKTHNVQYYRGFAEQY